MKVIDLHCDTLYKAVMHNLSFNDKSLEAKLAYDYNKLQCYAIWIPDDLNGDNAELLFNKAAVRIQSECKNNDIKLITSKDNIKESFTDNYNSAFFTVENGSAVNGKIDNIKRFSELGVKIITLTWNDRNIIGDGAYVKNPKGITDFGKQVVYQMEKYGIIVDVSHASDKLFYDVAEISNKPFIATHSNSQSVTPHCRNLSDEQFKIIAERKGLVGLNFHKDFLNTTSEKASIIDILKHTEYFMSLGGEDIIALGSDFDGCSLPDDIRGSESLSNLFELFLKHNYKETLVNKIFYENALNFFENFDI